MLYKSDIFEVVRIRNHLNLERFLKENPNPNTVNQKNNLGQTALMLAAEDLSIDFIDTLLKAKPDVLAKDKQGHTALYYANKQGRAQAAIILLNQVLQESEIENFNTIKEQCPLFFISSIDKLNQGAVDKFNIFKEAVALNEYYRYNNPLPLGERSDKDIQERLDMCITEVINDPKILQKYQSNSDSSTYRSN